MNRADTDGYDPRADRARTVGGAKARYVEQDGYGVDDLESDLERLLDPRHDRGRDRPPLPSFRGQVMLR